MKLSANQAGRKVKSCRSVLHPRNAIAVVLQVGCISNVVQAWREGVAFCLAVEEGCLELVELAFD